MPILINACFNFLNIQNCRRYIKKAGGKIDCAASNGHHSNGNGVGAEREVSVCEISPLVSYAGENLEHLAGKTMQPPVIVTP